MNITEAAARDDRRTVSDDAATFFAGGEAVLSGGDRPFLLDEAHAWFVAAGQADLFTVRLDERGEPVGPRTHLLRASAGQAFFGGGWHRPGVRWGLLAVGFQQTRLQRQPLALLQTAAPHTPAVTALVEDWIQALYVALVGDSPRAVSSELVSGEEAEVPAGGNCRPREELAWVRHLEGSSRLMGREGLELPLDDFVPVARRAWLQAGPASRLRVVDTPDLPSPAELWAGLARLHDLAARAAAQTERAGARAARDRARQKGAFQQAVLRDACERLAAGLGGAAAPDGAIVSPGDRTAVEDLDDPLFAACTLVGRAHGLAIKSYPRVQGAPPPRDPLAAILRASRVRPRQVALRGRWWREDNGPLLAYIAKDGAKAKRPVALLRPSATGSYVLHDPASGERRPMDAAAAEGLEPFAHSFYRPFPERALRVRDVLRFAIRGSTRDVIVLFGMAAAGSLLGMVPALATGMLFNTVIPGAQRSQLVQMTLVLLACAAAMALSSLTQGIALLRIEGRASGALQAAVWDRLLALPLGFFRPYTSGDLATRAMAIDAMRQVVSGSTVAALMGVILALGNIALMFWFSWQMALWASILIAFVILVTVAASVLQLRPQREAIALQSKAAGLVLQLLTGVAKLRVAGAEIPAFGLWARRFGEQRRLNYASRSIGTWIAALNAATPLLSSLVIFSIALAHANAGTLRTGDFLAFLTAFSSAMGAMLGASLALLATVNTLPLYEQARPILETLPEVSQAKSDPGVIAGDIEVQHAMFRYQQDGPLVLRDVSFRVQPGEFVAFVGPSGSGKSTLLRLLLGFETLESGSVYYDGQEIGGVDVQALRRQMGVVLQSGRLMSGDIFTNIVGSSGMTLKDAWEAARMAGLAEDIESMPMSMHTVVSEGGGTLSGGQRQRLLIARAIVSRPRILLLDEATSALDNRTQAIVSASLEALQATRIVVAHRLSTIINADRICVMERGRLVQSGSYAELMAQQGPFLELARRQIA